jgi:hypothetical protein
MSKAAELAKAGETLTNQPSGRKNIVINGAMQVAQRATSTTGIGAADNNFPCVDRMKVRAGSTAGRATVSQVADGPSGFANCLKFDCTTADASIAAGEYFFLTNIFEGQDLQQLKKGTSDAESVTISFYVKGDQAATYTLELKDQDNSRINTQTFAVTTSWNKISLTFIPDTTGAFGDDNLASLQVNLWLHAGSTYTGGTFASNTWASEVQANRVNSSATSFFDSTDREFFITGVQMEIGSQATNFEHRSFGEELLLCSRYFYGHVTGNLQVAYNGGFYGNNSATGHVYFKVPMRAAPTPIKVTGADYFLVYAASDVVYLDGDISANDVSVNGAGHYATTDATKTAGFACRVRSANAAARLGYDAEL